MHQLRMYTAQGQKSHFPVILDILWALKTARVRKMALGLGLLPFVYEVRVCTNMFKTRAVNVEAHVLDTDLVNSYVFTITHYNVKNVITVILLHQGVSAA